MLKIITLLVAFLFVSPLAVVAGEEWSQFRGPNGTGVSETKGLPSEFGPNKNVIWKTELPSGHSSPVLTRDRIFVTAHDKEKLFVIALDRQTGRSSGNAKCHARTPGVCKMLMVLPRRAR
jgi:hypothetical protein